MFEGCDLHWGLRLELGWLRNFISLSPHKDRNTSMSVCGKSKDLV